MEKYYEEKNPSRWEIGDEIVKGHLAGYTRSQDIDYDRERGRAGSPPNTVAFVYETDKSGKVISVERTTLYNVPLDAVLLN